MSLALGLQLGNGARRTAASPGTPVNGGGDLVGYTDPGGSPEPAQVSLALLDNGMPATTEITRVQCVADTNSSLHNTHFLISGANNDRIGVVMNCGGIKERTRFDFTINGGIDFATLGEGKAIIISNATDRIAFWGNTGTETEPNLSAYSVTLYVQVSLDLPDSSAQVEYKFANALDTYFDVPTYGGGGYLVVEDEVEGEREDGTTSDGGILFTATVEQQGRDAAASPNEVARAIFVDIVENASAEDVAGVVAAAIGADSDFEASANLDTVTIECSTSGHRDDAADVNSGFTVIVESDGADDTSLGGSLTIETDSSGGGYYSWVVTAQDLGLEGGHTAADAATALAAWVNGNASAALGAGVPESGTVNIYTTSTGITASLSLNSGDGVFGNASSPQDDSGEDGTPPSGDVYDLELIPAVPGSVITLSNGSFHAHETEGFGHTDVWTVHWSPSGLVVHVRAEPLGPDESGSLDLTNPVSPPGDSLRAFASPYGTPYGGSVTINVEGTRS